MNPSTDPAAALAPPPQPPQPHRLSTSCDRHPEERFTGFCPSCLCERLSVLDQTNNTASSSRKPPAISAAALKALFKPSSNGNANGNGRVKPGFFPELRRTKSFSASKNSDGNGLSGAFEPQRRSCDVRQTSLSNLFSQDEQRNAPTTIPGGEVDDEPRRSSVQEPVLEVNDEEEAESDDLDEDYVEACDFEIVNDFDGDVNGVTSEVNGVRSDEIVEEREEEIEEVEVPEELKPMKDYIDLDSHSQTKKPSVRRSFWSAASVFSKKLQKWRQNQKLKKRRNSGDHRPGSARLPVEKPIGRQLRDTQSEIADYGYGRRSCDTDPRFSLDAGRFSLDAGRFSVDIGRISVDDPRYSFDEPRASWDGSLIGRTVFPAAARPPPPPSMLSVVEDAPVHRHVTRTDMQIPVEEPPPPPPPQVVNNTSNNVSDPVIIPGGSIQTRDYYTDSSSRRRKSLDRSSSIRKTVVADVDEPKPPVSSIDTYSGSLRDNNYGVETTDNGFLRDPAITGERKVSSNDNNKKSRRWGKWSILGLIYRKSVNKYEEEEEEERYRRLNGGMVERSLSESWPELRNGGGPRMVRSNSNVSWRSSGGGMGRKVNGLERNKSSRYSPKNGENGMWKFYLAPMKGSRRMSESSSSGCPLARVRLSDILPYEGAPSPSYAKAVEALSASLMRYNASVIELGSEDTALMRCGLEAARLYFRTRSSVSGKPNRGLSMYRAGRSVEDLDSSPPCMAEVFRCLGKVARAALSAVARHLRLRSDVFNHMLDDFPLAPNEVSSSVLVSSYAHASIQNGKPASGGGSIEIEKGLLTLFCSDGSGIQVCDPNGRWYAADSGCGIGDILLITGKALSHATAGLRPAASYRATSDHFSGTDTRGRASLAFRLMPKSNAILDCSPVEAAGHVIPQSYVPVSVSQFMDNLLAENETPVTPPVKTNVSRDDVCKEPSLRSVLSDPVSGAFLEDAIVVSCGHSFGGLMLRRVLEMSRCTLCNAEIEPGSLVPNHALRAAASAIKQQDDKRLFHNAAMRRRRKEMSDQMDVEHGDPATDDGLQQRVVHYPFAVNEKVLIKGNRRTPEKYVGKEAIVTSQCLNGWYLLKIVESGDSVRLQYRSLKKMTNDDRGGGGLPVQPVESNSL